MASTNNDRDPFDKAEVRTTLTGNPIPTGADRKHDHHTNMMMAEGGGGLSMGGAGANLLPPGYTDKTMVRIPIREADLEPEPEPAAQEYQYSDTASPEVQTSSSRKGSFGGMFNNLKKSISARQRERESGFQMVDMTRGDYLKYWVKGKDGKFLDSVQEPPEGRREWVCYELVLH